MPKMPHRNTRASAPAYSWRSIESPHHSLPTSPKSRAAGAPWVTRVRIEPLMVLACHPIALARSNREVPRATACRHPLDVVSQNRIWYRDVFALLRLERRRNLNTAGVCPDNADRAEILVVFVLASQAALLRIWVNSCRRTSCIRCLPVSMRRENRSHPYGRRCLGAGNRSGKKCGDKSGGVMEGGLHDCGTVFADFEPSSVWEDVLPWLVCPYPKAAFPSQLIQ